MSRSTLLRVSSLGKWVQQSAEHCNAGSDTTEKGHRGLKDNARAYDNHDSLKGVGNGVSDRGKLVEGQKGGLQRE